MIRGIELRNFMSYEHAYVPLSPGLNLICGPNGSGKSSILVGISLVLGQAHTERSRRLSDLIRWGQPEARISLILDNEIGDGKRLFPHRREDRVSVTRVLRSSGSYFYLVEGHPVTKVEVREAFEKLGIFPDNMLIIMHQMMVHRFASVSPQEKLRMLEEAVGFHGYRDDVLEALGRLRETGQEARTLEAVLQSTEQSYEFWRREFERYQRKKALEIRLRELDAELAWTRVVQSEAAVTRLRRRLDATRREFENIESAIAEADKRSESAESSWSALKAERGHIEQDLLEAVRQEASSRAVLAWTEEWGRAVGGELYPRLRDVRDRVQKEAEAGRAALEKIDARLHEIEKGLEAGLAGVVDGRVDSKVQRFRAQLVGEEIRRIEGQLRSELEELDVLVAEAEKLGPRVAPRKVGEIHAEVAAIKEEMVPLAHLSDEVEKVYAQYLESFESLRARAQALADHRKGLEAELAKRADRWREVVQDLLDKVSRDYDMLLQEAGGTGRIRLVSTQNIEKSGLEILVGFHGQDPVPLESFAQSGGERSIAMTAFLFGLQRRLASPFRAIDEFDVHLDPHNRDIVARMIVANVSGLEGIQYVAITPGPVSPPKGVSVIVAQNVAGTAQIGRFA